MSHPKEITLHVGGVHASAEPVIIKTLLGSCVAVCLWDPRTAVGGMNHFLLPQSRREAMVAPDDATRFGVHAMDRLVGEMLKLGAAPSRFVVKVFGGASVLAMPGAAAGTIPHANVEFVRTFLAREGLRVAATSVGGMLPRMIHFLTDSGRVLVRRIVTPRARTLILEEEERERRARPRFGDVTFFEGGE